MVWKLPLRIVPCPWWAPRHGVVKAWTGALHFVVSAPARDELEETLASWPAALPSVAARLVAAAPVPRVAWWALPLVQVQVRPAAAQVAGRVGRVGVARTTARMQDAEGAHAASGGMEEADVLPGKGAEGAESVVRALALGALEERQEYALCVYPVSERQEGRHRSAVRPRPLPPTPLPMPAPMPEAPPALLQSPSPPRPHHRLTRKNHSAGPLWAPLRALRARWAASTGCASCP